MKKINALVILLILLAVSVMPATAQDDGTISIMHFFGDCGEESATKLEAMGFEVERIDNDVRINLKEGSLVKDIMDRLSSSDIQFKDVSTIEPSLEDAFINLVGGKMVGGELTK